MTKQQVLSQITALKTALYRARMAYRADPRGYLAQFGNRYTWAQIQANANQVIKRYETMLQQFNLHHVSGFSALSAFGDVPGSPIYSNINYAVEAGQTIGSMQNPLILMDGRAVETSDIQFDASTYHFTLGSTGEDITNNLTRAQKIILVPNFDVAIDNDRLYREQTKAATGTDPGPPLPTGTGFILGQTASNIGSSVSSAVNAAVPHIETGIKQLIFLSLVAGAVYLVLVQKKIL